MAKRESMVWTWDSLSNVVKLSDRESGATLREWDMGKLSPAMRQRLAFWGFKSKTGDGAALPMGAGRDAKLHEMDDIAERLYNDEWDAQRAKLSPEEKAAKLRQDVYEGWAALRSARGASFVEGDFAEWLRSSKTPDGKRVPEDAAILAASRDPRIAAEIAKNRAARLAGVSAIELGDI